MQVVTDAMVSYIRGLQQGRLYVAWTGTVLRLDRCM